MSNFYGGQFFGGGFFGPITTTTEETPFKGGRGDNKKRGDGIYKPTGLQPKRKTLTLKKDSLDIKRRLEETEQIAIEVAGEIARELAAERIAREVFEITELEVSREIGRLLHKKIRTEEDEIILLLLMAAASA